MHLTDLPRELLHHSLSFLTLPAILPLSAASHTFHNLVAQEISKRQRAAAKLRHQTFCYHLFAPIDRFGVPLVRCTVIDNRQPAPPHDGSEEQQPHAHHEYATTLTPRIECKSVILQQHESSLAKDIKYIQSERRVRLDDEVRFAQLIYKFEIIQYSPPSPSYSHNNGNSSPGAKVGRCSGSSIVAEGVVRVFRSWLDESIALQSQDPDALGRLPLAVDEDLIRQGHINLNIKSGSKEKRIASDKEDKLVVLRTSVRAGSWNEHTGDKTYYVRVHDVEINSTFLIIKSEQAEISGAAQDAAAHAIVSTTIVAN